MPNDLIICLPEKAYEIKMKILLVDKNGRKKPCKCINGQKVDKINRLADMRTENSFSGQKWEKKPCKCING